MEITKEAYSEVYAIINLLSWNLISKIPDNILENIENKMDKAKIIEIDNIEEYKVSDEANKLLAVLYKNYFATDEEKNIIDAKEKILYQKEQKDLHEKYNPDNLFDKNKLDFENPSIETTNLSVVECEESIFIRIKNWIKKFFEK